MSLAVSVVIVAHNEEHNIEACINSVKWAEEVVVLNAGSTDRTAELAISKGAKIIDGSNQDNPEINKNKAFKAAQGPWILSLDADEQITPELRDEILGALKNSDSFIAYWIPRQNMWSGRWIKYYRGPCLIKDYQLRLFQKGKGEYPAQTVDQVLTVTGPVGKLKKYIFHESCQGKDDVFHQIYKINKYSTVHARYLADSGFNPSLYHILVLPSLEFLKHHFILFGYLNGLPGLTIDLFRGLKIFLNNIKTWELHLKHKARKE